MTYSVLVFRSKNGFFEDALTGIAITHLQSPNIPKRCAAIPALNITRVSRRKSDAVAQAEPTAMPKSTELIAQGTASGFSTVRAIQTLNLLACTSNHDSFSLKNIVSITQKEF